MISSWKSSESRLPSVEQSKQVSLSSISFFSSKKLIGNKAFSRPSGDTPPGQTEKGSENMIFFLRPDFLEWKKGWADRAVILR